MKGQNDTETQLVYATFMSYPFYVSNRRSLEKRNRLPKSIFMLSLPLSLCYSSCTTWFYTLIQYFICHISSLISQRSLRFSLFWKIESMVKRIRQKLKSLFSDQGWFDLSYFLAILSKLRITKMSIFKGLQLKYMKCKKADTTVLSLWNKALDTILCSL